MASSSISIKVVATVGSVNLDYRSLYLHFECGVWMYKTRAVAQLKEDFLHTLEVSEEIRAADCRCGVLFRLFQEVLRLLAPLM